MQQPCVLNSTLIPGLLTIARENWNDWRDVFEHKGPISTNPLLDCRNTFRKFLAEYSVNRTIQAKTHDAFRLALRDSPQFEKAIGDGTGRALDEIELKLRESFGTHDPKYSIISVLSKVAAFVRPEQFVARDSYSMEGLKKVLKKVPALKASFQRNTYARYLEAFDHLWEEQPGKEIRNYKITDPHAQVENEPRFLRRVLDVHLMQCGGREFKRRDKAHRRIPFSDCNHHSS
jgi:hypothetical protein